MALVKEYMSGNCKIRFYDDYVVKTKEEVQKILDDVGKIYAEELLERVLRGESIEGIGVVTGDECIPEIEPAE